MTEEDRAFLMSRLQEMIDGHWKVTQALLELQRYLGKMTEESSAKPFEKEEEGREL